LATLCQIDRQRQPDRPGADDYNWIFGDAARDPILIGVTTIAELRR